MDLKKFFAAYEKQQTENFFEVFADNLPKNFAEMQKRGFSFISCVRYLLKYPEFVKGNEMALISLMSSLAQAVMDKDEGVKSWHLKYLCEATNLFALVPMREFLLSFGANMENDLAIAEHIEIIARCTIKLKNSTIVRFWKEVVPEWCKSYPLVIKVVHNEIYIANRMTMSYGNPLPKYREELEQQYLKLLSVL